MRVYSIYCICKAKTGTDYSAVAVEGTRHSLTSSRTFVISPAETRLLLRISDIALSKIFIAHLNRCILAGNCSITSEYTPIKMCMPNMRLKDQNKNPTRCWVLILVDSSRENWNYIFSGLIELNNRLEQLGIDAMIHDADDSASIFPVNPPMNSTTFNLSAQGRVRSSHV